MITSYTYPCEQIKPENQSKHMKLCTLIEYLLNGWRSFNMYLLRNVMNKTRFVMRDESLLEETKMDVCVLFPISYTYRSESWVYQENHKLSMAWEWFILNVFVGSSSLESWEAPQILSNLTFAQDTNPFIILDKWLSKLVPFVNMKARQSESIETESLH